MTTDPEPIPSGWQCGSCGAMLSPYIAECPGCAADPGEAAEAVRLCAVFTRNSVDDYGLAAFMIRDDHAPLLGMPLADRIEALNLRTMLERRNAAKSPRQLARERHRAIEWLLQRLSGIPEPSPPGTEPGATEPDAGTEPSP